MFARSNPQRPLRRVLAGAAMLLVIPTSLHVTGFVPAESPAPQTDPASQLYLPLVGQKLTAPDLRRVTDTSGEEVQPALSPDNRQVVYVSVDAAGGTDLFLVDWPAARRST